MLGIVDAVIIVIILMFGATGIKNGFFKQTVVTVGTILVFVLSYYFKDFLANWFSYNLPFFDYAGPFQGLETINIILYQMIAFLIMIVLLTSVLIVALKIMNVFEWLLKITIIGGLVSKILGFFVGLIEGYVIAFIIVFFLSQPAVSLNIVDESKLMPKILESSPVLSGVVSETNETIKEMYDLVDAYNKDKDADKFNHNAINVMLKNKVITVNYVETLIEKDKLKTKNLKPILDKYR